MSATRDPDASGASSRPLPDLCDDYAEIVRVTEPVFASFGGRRRFGGAIRTLKCFEDNSVVADRVTEPGEGRVLVVDGGGSKRCALVGDNLARAAGENGWAGLVVYGCVRDVEILRGIDVGIKALAAHPRRSIKRGIGERDVVVEFAGVLFVPDQFLYADDNGILVAPKALD